MDCPACFNLLIFFYLQKNYGYLAKEAITCCISVEFRRHGGNESTVRIWGRLWHCYHRWLGHWARTGLEVLGLAHWDGRGGSLLQDVLELSHSDGSVLRFRDGGSWAGGRARGNVGTSKGLDGAQGTRDNVLWLLLRHGFLGTCLIRTWRKVNFFLVYFLGLDPICIYRAAQICTQDVLGGQQLAHGGLHCIPD
ncbi:hypothetical protein FR483_n623R [Paramecium bursaria Chlorella virus FR483]|uniref:Uncharacterized protein n623R n=1 Tax=Paramecium bursaria Chlorella virus FR483 TaxID=399781 RepID=A7J7X7_PBCVF|nr:hypothetical protein FR483_n623R [Paramecium bursaria Chlorella virus FR483]ABT15908.1 hypothetical protein FR483_n623R [Paramecium bursaria Chlorella virus FR483]